MSDELSASCGKLPFPCETCPTCGHGIKNARGWTWIDGDKLKIDKECTKHYCDICPLGPTVEFGKAGLLWIGEKFYHTPADFLREANTMGVSRRISAIPKDFKLGETWVFLAHRKAITERCECVNNGMNGEDCPICNGEKVVYHQGIFRVFKPKRIECIVSGDEPDDYIERLVKRGITPVKVQKQGEQAALI